MTPEAQQRAIAIACGKTPLCGHSLADHSWPTDWQAQNKPYPFHYRQCERCPALHIKGERTPTWDTDKIAPDYLNDLNTRPEMLFVLVDFKMCKDFDSTFMNAWEALTITQPDFCKRFLGTIGKWVEETESQPCH